MKQKQKKQRPSRWDRLTAAVMQTHAHESTADIARRRDVLSFELIAIDEEIVALSARTADAKARRARVEATLLGLGIVVGRR